MLPALEFVLTHLWFQDRSDGRRNEHANDRSRIVTHFDRLTATANLSHCGGIEYQSCHDLFSICMNKARRTLSSRIIAEGAKRCNCLDDRTRTGKR